MAMQLIFGCDHCDFAVAAWDEGNPYVEGPDGTRHYFYHPSETAAGTVALILGRKPTAAELDEMLRNHIGNEQDHICLDCGDRSRRNGREAKLPCSACGSREVANAYHLAGKRCPSCKKGTFGQGRMGAIS